MIKEAHITARNLSRVIFLRALQYPLLILFVLIVPKMMGPEIYGKYAFFASIFAILGASTRLGTEETFGRFIPEFTLKQDKLKINKLLHHILFLRATILIILGLSLLSIFSIFLKWEDIKLYLIIVIATLVLGIEGTLYNLLYGLNYITKFTMRDLIRKIFNLLFIIVMFKYFDLFGAVLALLISEFIVLIIALYWTNDYLDFINFKLDIAFLRQYLKFGSQFYITSLILIFLQYLGNPLIQFLSKNTSEVAFYDLANQIYLTLSSFMFFIFSAMIPIFSTLLVKNREDKIIKWSSLILKYTGIISIIIFSSILLIGYDLIIIIFGDEYIKVYDNLVILLIGLFAYLISLIGIVYSIIYKQPKKYLIAIIISFITYLMVSLLLIPEYASIGSSTAILFSTLTLAILFYLQFNHQFKALLNPFLKVVLLGLILITFFYYKTTSINNLQLFFLYLSFYLTMLILLKYITIYELRELINALKGSNLKD